MSDPGGVLDLCTYMLERRAGNERLDAVSATRSGEVSTANECLP